MLKGPNYTPDRSDFESDASLPRRDAVARAQTILTDAYAAARNGDVIFEHAPDITMVIEPTNGATSYKFPLPNGETIRDAATLGLGRDIGSVALKSVKQDTVLIKGREMKGVWCELLVVDLAGECFSRHVFVSATLRGRAAVLVSYSDTQKFQFESYRAAKKDGHVKFRPPREITEVIECSQGKTQRTFLLSNGERARKQFLLNLDKAEAVFLSEVTYLGGSRYRSDLHVKRADGSIDACSIIANQKQVTRLE